MRRILKSSFFSRLLFVRVNCPLFYSGYRIVEKFTADYPMALQIRDLLHYDLFGECVRRVSSILIDNNYLLTPKSLREAVLQSGNHNVGYWPF